MVSMSARLVNLGLPLLGIRRFFSEPDKLDERIAKLRRQASPRPGKKLHAQFDISEDTSRGYPVVTMVPKGGVKEGSPHLLYLHGGGYVMDIAALHWSASDMPPPALSPRTVRCSAPWRSASSP